jgi:hypothetical protein
MEKAGRFIKHQGINRLVRFEPRSSQRSRLEQPQNMTLLSSFDVSPLGAAGRRRHHTNIKCC